MCTSLAPGFYLKDMESYENWKQQMYRIKNRYKDECIFSISDKEPRFMREETQSDSSFEVIEKLPKTEE